MGRLIFAVFIVLGGLALFTVFQVFQDTGILYFLLIPAPAVLVGYGIGGVIDPKQTSKSFQ